MIGVRHSRPVSKHGVNSSGNPKKDWIPGQARDDRLRETLVRYGKSDDQAED